LAPLLGHPMIEWVYKQAIQALPKVIVATDDERIVKAVKRFGGKAMMTPSECLSGTDRMYCVSQKVHAKYFVNIQGDEPLINPHTIRNATLLAMKKNAIGTAATDLPISEKTDVHVVKVALGFDSRALYFSRSALSHPSVLKHQGLYIYPKEVLKEFVRLPQPTIEQEERLEQWRPLYYGFPIYVSYSKKKSVGVDTPDDLIKVEKILKTEAKTHG